MTVRARAVMGRRPPGKSAKLMVHGLRRCAIANRKDGRPVNVVQAMSA
jgi:hypothetical protein